MKLGLDLHVGRRSVLYRCDRRNVRSIDGVEYRHRVHVVQVDELQREENTQFLICRLRRVCRPGSFVMPVISMTSTMLMPIWMLWMFWFHVYDWLC